MMPITDFAVELAVQIQIGALKAIDGFGGAHTRVVVGVGDGGSLPVTPGRIILPGVFLSKNGINPLT